MANLRLLPALIALLSLLGFSFSEPTLAALPPGNAVKDPYAILRNSLPIDQKKADLIVEEANKAFQYNMEMFQELEGNLVAAIGKMLFGLLTSKKRKGSTEKTRI